MKEIKCYLLAIIDWLKCVFTHFSFPPFSLFVHEFVEQPSRKAIIISTDTSFRVSKGYAHEFGETVHPHATLFTDRCRRCGKERHSWFDGGEEDIPRL